MIRRKPWLLFLVKSFALRFARRAYTDDLVDNYRSSNGMWMISIMNDHTGYVVWRMVRNECRVYRMGLLFGQAMMLVDHLASLGTENRQCTCHLESAAMKRNGVLRV